MPTSLLTPLQLAYREPYDAAGVLNFLLPRAVPGVELVNVAQASIQRTVSVEHAGRIHHGWVQAAFGLGAARVDVGLSPSLQPALASLEPWLRRWLDLDADPPGIAQALGEGAVRGQRLPGCLDRFELAVRAVLGQQITVAAARTLAARFVGRFGASLADAPAGADRLFPSAACMAAETPERIAELGIIRRRAYSILELARRWPELRYAQLSGTPDDAMAELQGIAGIGPWTAHYMLMRGWSWPDAFPPGDVILRRQLSRGLDALLSPKACLAAAERYRPYRSYAVLHLWRSYMAA